MKKLLFFTFVVFSFVWVNAQTVELKMTLTTTNEGVCTEAFEVLLHVENYSSTRADNVECRLKLPPYITFVNPSDTVIKIPAIYATEWEEYYIPLRNTGSFTSSSYIPVMGQITYCDQADVDFAYGQWDWTGEPSNRLCAVVRVPVGHVMSLRDIEITNARICKGDTALLTASANIDYPQKFVWYSQNLQSIVKTETIYAGSSSFMIPDCRENTTYYVAVSNEDVCPIVLPYTYKDVLLNTSTDQGTTIVQYDDNISFYDEGGQNANYISGDGTWVHTFKTEETTMFVSMDMIDLGQGDVLNIYGGPNTSSPLLHSYTFGSTPESFRWGNHILTFEFVQQGGAGAGWKATIRTKEDSKTVSTVLLNAANDRGMSYVSLKDSVLLYDDGGEGIYTPGDNSYTFTAMLGHVRADFSGKSIGIRSGDTLFLYDGESIDAPVLTIITQVLGTSATETMQYVSSGQSLTFRLKAVGQQSGWRAKITMVDLEASFGKASATLKAPGDMSSHIHTTDAEVCYGSRAILTASADIGYPQYYTWFNKERTSILQCDTVYSGSSELNVLTTENETYYVTVYNDTTCPLTDKIHDNQLIVLMGVNGDQAEKQYSLQVNDSLLFYDAGGPNENMDCSNFNNGCWNQSLSVSSPEDTWIRVHLNSFDKGAYWPYMEIYKYNSNWESEQVAYIIQDLNDKDFVIESNHIRLNFSNNCQHNSSFPGWDGYIYAISPIDTNILAKAKLTIKKYPATDLIAEGGETCYGGEVNLKATSTLDVPQYFTWYDQDHITIVKRDTVYTQGEVSGVTVLPVDNGPYYVAVTNDYNCPVVESIHNQYHEFRLDGLQTEYRIQANDSIGFFDSGGPDGNCEIDNGWTPQCSFIAPEGYRIRLHLNNVQLDDEWDSYMRIEVYSNQYTEYGDRIIKDFWIFGTQANFDTIFNSNYIRISFDNYSNQNFPGWDGYIYAIKSHDEEEHVSVPVSFLEPIISQSITADDVEACYGETVTLTATNGSGIYRYIWYDENYNLIEDFVGENSTIDVTAMSKTSYYVNASNPEECPVLPPHYGEFWFDASKNGGITNLTEDMSIPFYDAGGSNANYNTPNADWTHTFVAPIGKQVTLKLNHFYANCGHRLYVYDGTPNDYYTSYSFECYQGNINRVITSHTGILTVRWYISYNGNNFDYSGWEGLVGVMNNQGELPTKKVNLKTANVNIKEYTINPTLITTNDGEACYGADAVLTASSTMSGTQTYYW